jgi:hypothetical protein
LWALLDSARTEGDILSGLEAQLDDPPLDLVVHVERFLQALETQGLGRVGD